MITITIRRRSYVSENNCDVTFTRLGLDVEEVDTIFPDSITSITADTKKRWVGTIGKTTNTFDIIKPNPSILPARLLEGNVFNLYVRGRVTSEGSGARVSIDFRVGVMAFAMFILMYFMSIGGAIMSIAQEQWYS